MKNIQRLSAENLQSPDERIKWRGVLCSTIGRVNIVDMLVQIVL